MKIDDAIAAIKEFFLEILGFLLPGFAFLFLCYALLRNEYKLEIDNLLQKEYSGTIAITISYIFGYILYGISEAWHSLRTLLNPIHSWLSKNFKCLFSIYDLQEDIKKSPEYMVVLDIIHENVGIQKDVLESSSVNDIRNIAMSYVPEADRKIYNFMFRAELSSKINFALQIIAFGGLFSWFLEKYFNTFGLFKTSDTSLWIYFTCIILAFFLRKTRKRFFGIAMKMIFPIFIVKYKMQEPIKK